MRPEADRRVARRNRRRHGVPGLDHRQNNVPPPQL